MTSIFRNNISLILVISFIGLAGYSFMLGSDFKTMDEESTIVSNPDIQSFSNAGKLLCRGFFNDHSYYRPLISLSYMGEYRLFGLNSFFYNLDNVLLHIATGIFIFFIISLILEDIKLGFFTALLFVIHPVHWEAVSNISGRAIVLSTFFHMGAFLSFCLFMQEAQKKGYFFLSLSFFALSLLCKESAVTFPFIVFAYTLFLNKKNSRNDKNPFLLSLPFFSVMIGYFVIRRIFGITEIFHWESVSDALLGFLTFLRAVLEYLRIFIFPTDLHFDRAIVLFKSFLNEELLATVSVFFLCGFLLFQFRKKISQRVTFFIVWFFIELVPVSQIFPISVQPGMLSAAEHFLYAASVGIFASIVLFFRWCYKIGLRNKLFSGKVFFIGVASLYAFLFILLVKQNIYADNEMSMFQQSIDYNPQNARIQNSLAIAYAKKRMIPQAQRHFLKALSIDPDNVLARIGFGKSLCDQGKYFEGIVEYEKIHYPEKYKELLKSNLKLTYGLLVWQYEAKIAQDPHNPGLHYSLGVVFSKMQKVEDAIKEYEQAVAMDPGFGNALFNLASSYEAVGTLEKAADYYIKAIDAVSQNHEFDYYSYFHLGLIYQKLGNADKARDCFKKSLEINPSSKEAKEKLSG